MLLQVHLFSFTQKLLQHSTISAITSNPHYPSPALSKNPNSRLKQGCFTAVAQSRYAWTHKDSHTKPLHDATAQMAVDAQMQRHKQLTLQRCKTNRASNAKHPFLTTIEVFRQTAGKGFSLSFFVVYIKLIRFVKKF